MEKIRNYVCAALVLIAIMCTLFTAPASAASKPKLTKSSLTLKIGSSYKLTLKNAKAAKVKWKSSGVSVAKVNSRGKIKAKNKGTTVVTAVYKGKKYSCKLTVKPVSVIKSGSFNVYVNDTLKLTCTVPVKRWVVANKKIASVNSKGLIKGKKSGKTTVVAECKNGTEVKGILNVKNPFNSLKEYINKNGKSDENNNKYIASKKDKYYFDITYISSKKTFQFSGYYTGSAGSYLLAMDIPESGSSKPAVTSYFQSKDEENEYYAKADINSAAYKATSTVDFKIVSGNVTDAESVNDLSNSLLNDSFNGWKSILKNNLGMSLSAIGFSKF